MFLEEWGFPVINDFFKSIGEIFLTSVFIALFVLFAIGLGIIIIIIYIVVKKAKKPTSRAILKRAPNKTNRGGRKR